MRFISPLLKHAVFPGLAKLGYLGSRDGGNPAILTYHGIMPAGYKMMGTDCHACFSSPAPLWARCRACSGTSSFT